MTDISDEHAAHGACVSALIDPPSWQTRAMGDRNAGNLAAIALVAASRPVPTPSEGSER